MTVLPPPDLERRWHYRRSLASRVTILTALAAGATVALVAFGAYLTVRMQLQATLDDSLLDRATQAAKSETLAAITNDCDIPSWAVGAADVRIAFIQLDQPKPVQTCDRSTPTLELGQREVDVAAGEAKSSIRTIYADGEPYRVVTVRTTNRGQALVVAQSLEGQETVLRKLGIVMLLFGLAGVIGAGIAGWAVARNGLRPVRRLTDAAEHIARTEDLRPLPVEGGDELARLSTAFNQMLAALAASRDRQRQLVADAGHELRTPLTSLRTNLDLLSQVDAEGVGLPREARAELLEDVHAQIEELTTLIGDLVELARDEPLTHVVEPVDVEGQAGCPGTSSARAPVSSAPSPTCSTTPRSGAPTTARSRSGSSTARSPSTTRAPASRRPTGRTSSTASTAPRSRAGCPAPDSASRSCVRSRSGTPAR